MNNYEEFYERIKQIAKTQNKNVRAVVEECGINYDSYNSYKRYGNLPRADEAVRIAEALNTTVEYLVTGNQSDSAAALNELKKKFLEFAQSIQ